jgi:hemophore-related protein
MLFSGVIVRRAVAGAIGFSGVAVAMLSGAPSALAEPTPPPNCTAGDFTGVVGGVAMATSAYMFTHPDVNDFFTSLEGERTNERRVRVVNYFNANPQVHAELDAIRQPLVEIKNRCGFTNDDPDNIDDN